MKTVITSTGYGGGMQIGAYISLRGVSSPEWFVITNVISKTCVEIEPFYDYDRNELKAFLLLLNLVVWEIVFYIGVMIFI